MTDISLDSQTVGNENFVNHQEPATIAETYWGYIVHNKRTKSAAGRVLQGAAFLLGVGFTITAIGLWLPPGLRLQIDTLTLRFGMSIFLVILGYLFFRLSHRTGDIEWHFDLNLGEIRKVSGCRKRQGVVINHMGFDVVKGFKVVHHCTDPYEMSLCFETIDANFSPEIARGGLEKLTVIAARLRGDLSNGGHAQQYQAVAPTF